MANFPGTAGNDSLVGANDIADVFTFAYANLSADDTIIGGSGATTDTLRLTTSGNITASVLANTSGLEQISFAATGNNLALDSAFLTANGNKITVIGNDLAATVTITSLVRQTVTYLAFAGGDTITGGAGSEIVEASGPVFGDLGAGDDDLRLANRAAQGGTLAGGLGYDVITLNLGGLWNLSSYTGFEEIFLTKNTTLTLGAQTGQRVEGSTSRDFITLGASQQVVHADLGDDEVRTNIANLSGAFLSGGSGGRDTLVLTEAGTYVLGQGHIITGFERLIVANGTSDYSYIKGNTSSFGEIVLRSGANVTMSTTLTDQSVRGSRFIDEITVQLAGQVVEAGAGDDRIYLSAATLAGGAMIAGGAGFDRLDMSRISGGTLRFAELAVSGIEWLIMPNTSFAVGNAEMTRVDAGSGNCTLEGLAENVTLQGGFDDDTLILGVLGGRADGRSGADLLLLEAEDLAGFALRPMVLDGGFGASIDTLQVGRVAGLAGAGKLDFNAILASRIDKITVANSVTALELILTDAMVATSDGDGNGTAGDIVIAPVNASLTTPLKIDGSSLTGANRIDTFSSGLAFNGADTILGGAGADSVSSGAGNDLLDMGAGFDRIASGVGDDTIMPGVGVDSIQGDAGGDLIVLANDGLFDKIFYVSSADGTADLDAGGVTEARADRITNYELATDQFVFDRAAMGLGAGSVTRVPTNGAWNPASAPVFLLSASDTILADNFATTAALAALNTDAKATGSGAATSTILFVSNLESSATRRTGIYHWMDEGDGVIEAGDTIRLLGVIDGVTTNQILLSNILLV